MINLIYNNQKAFSLIGVLVASSIGLIVIAGISQIFGNMAMHFKKIETQTKFEVFKSQIKNYMLDPEACKRTLEGRQSHLLRGGLKDTKFTFTKIKNSSNQTVFDLEDPDMGEIMKRDYGLKGYRIFEMSCSSSFGCRSCRNMPPGTCDSGEWEMRLVSQSEIRGVTLFNRPDLIVKTNIQFSKGSNPGAPPLIFSCNVGGGLAGQKCPNGRVLTGFDSNGNIECKGVDLANLEFETIEIKECSTKWDGIMEVSCRSGYKLISCSGSDGDHKQGNTHGEGAYITPDYENDKCTMKYRYSKCHSYIDYSHRRLRAHCFKVP